MGGEGNKLRRFRKRGRKAQIDGGKETIGRGCQKTCILHNDLD